MDAYQAVAAAIKATGIPFTQWSWPTGKAPALPWCCVLVDDHGDFHADDTNYATLPHVRVELYQKELDERVAASVRDALATIGPTSEMTDWIPDEGCAMTTFQLTYTDRREQNNG